MIYTINYALLSFGALLFFILGVYLAENDLKNNKGDQKNNKGDQKNEKI